MKALILAAGEGTRLRPITYQTPKPMIDINDKPLLQYSLEQLNGLVEQAIIVIGYKGEQIKEYFGQNFAGLPLRYLWQRKLLGTADAIRQARPHLNGRFLILMGDTIYSKMDIENALKYDLCILVKEVDTPRRYGIIETDENGYLKNMVEKPDKPQSKLANTALYVLDEAIFSEIDKLKLKENGEYDFTEALIALAQKRPIYCLKVQGHWLPVGYHEELEFARKTVKEQATDLY